ncbi:SGNH/GDSL hydrolase family protein [Neisseria perflava]|uniref:SGNH/GDSL hydrolase family protein n=1 Tax=Neisseria perflava TaxID=33053 RepID=UPI0020A1FDFE|nr:SGNH/GDSL hydrolase family protein [Neisseria perflava]MCP1660824.1 lysophospholipase L1-like esterase [Neisseria perflava]MCP1773290.1 lysophospholipase L1-like esterase [Neisseria perflava]
MTVYLIGDSIRLGYEPFVRRALADTRIFTLPQNGQSSREVLQTLPQATTGIQPGDIVHLNCGLHDIRRNQGVALPVSDLNTYLGNLQQIFQSLRKMQAKVIWASSTPFLEQVHNLVKPSRRYLADICLYNQSADKLARKFGFAVNDLYGLMFEQDLTALMVCDGLHFNEFGHEILGKAVAESIRRQMNVG